MTLGVLELRRWLAPQGLVTSSTTLALNFPTGIPNKRAPETNRTMPHFVSITFHSELYQETLSLRNRLLRKPLGLELTAQQLAGEEEQRHFGLLDHDDLHTDSTHGVLVACVIVVPLSETHVKLRQMAVDDSRQRSGLGTRLIQCVEDELRKDGVGSIELNAREPAIGFYERLGYKPEGPRFVEVTIAHQKMVKQLT